MQLAVSMWRKRMSEISGLIKKSEDPKQFFQTLPEQVECFVDYMDGRISSLSFIDAGSGEGAIANHLKSRGFTNVTTLDNNFPADIEMDFMDFTPDTKFDVCISNPPYTRKLKYAFIDKALEIADMAVMFYPLQCLNYIDFNERYLDTDKYSGRVSMYPKMVLNPDGDHIQGGNTGYAWFIFSNSEWSAKSSKKYEYLYDIRKFKQKDAVWETYKPAVGRNTQKDSRTK